MKTETDRIIDLWIKRNRVDYRTINANDVKVAWLKEQIRSCIKKKVIVFDETGLLKALKKVNK